MARLKYIYWDGQLRGNGQEVDCRVQAVVTKGDRGQKDRYTQYRILSVARDVPAGDYELTVNDIKLPM